MLPHRPTQQWFKDLVKDKRFRLVAFYSKNVPCFSRPKKIKSEEDIKDEQVQQGAQGAQKVKGKGVKGKGASCVEASKKRESSKTLWESVKRDHLRRGYEDICVFELVAGPANFREIPYKLIAPFFDGNAVLAAKQLIEWNREKEVEEKLKKRDIKRIKKKESSAAKAPARTYTCKNCPEVFTHHPKRHICKIHRCKFPGCKSASEETKLTAKGLLAHYKYQCTENPDR